MDKLQPSQRIQERAEPSTFSFTERDTISLHNAFRFLYAAHHNGHLMTRKKSVAPKTSSRFKSTVTELEDSQTPDLTPFRRVKPGKLWKFIFVHFRERVTVTRPVDIRRYSFPLHHSLYDPSSNDIRNPFFSRVFFPRSDRSFVSLLKRNCRHCSRISRTVPKRRLADREAKRAHRHSHCSRVIFQRPIQRIF